MAAMCELINRHRLLKNWGVMEASEAEPIAKVWVEFLNNYGVPATAYRALYDRAVESRSMLIQNGKEAGELTAESLLACWTGANGLRAELEAERIKRGRTLTGNAQSQCPKCYGTGFEYAKDSSGREIGIKGRCDHIFEHIFEEVNTND
jgi:hypothetical protein